MRPRDIMILAAAVLGMLGAGGASAAPARPALTPADVAHFFDARMPAMLARGDIAGGVVVVVRDGRVLFARGYGFASLADRRRFSVDRTLLRPGSISKLFTWIAVLQQVEQGRLDLDRDVNAYLDFRIPPKFGRPITLRNLMTHSAGFEEVSKDLFVPDAAHLYPLGDYLERRLPARLFAPGTLIAYSNYGTALAGHIVERVSGESYDRYIRDHILAPLAMTHTTAVQPLPARFRPFMAGGYVSRSDGKPQPFELIEAAPAGAISATGADIGRFMIALLDRGRSAPNVLRPATFDLMQRHQLSAAPGRNGFTLGMFENDRNGLRIVGHDGDTLWFHSDLELIPAERTGVFLSLNSAGNGLDIRRRMFRAFLDRYFPFAAPSLPTAPTARVDARRVTGWYETTRRYETVLALSRSLYQLRVSALPDGTISVPIWGDAQDRRERWREIGPLVYQEVGGQAKMAFVAGRDGAIRHFVSDDNTPIETFQRVARLETKPALTIALALSIAALAGALVGSIFVDVRRRRSGAATGRGPVWVVSRAGLVLVTLALAGWPVLIRTIAAHFQWRLGDGGDLPLYLGYTASLFALFGVAAILWRAIANRRTPSRLDRSFDWLGVVGAGYFVWFVSTYRLVSFDVGY